MGIINEKEFKKVIGDRLKSIDKSTKDLNGIFDDVIKNAKMDFEDAEKLLVAKIADNLDDKLKKYKDIDWKYENLKGSYGKTVGFRFEEWPEFKKYCEFVECKYPYDVINEHLRHSFKKYGLTNFTVGVDNHAHLGIEANFNYSITKSWYPGIGGKDFFMKEEKEK